MDGSDPGRPAPVSIPDAASMQRTPELWYDDGTSVIQAVNHQFRIHRGILTTRSPVLRTLFSDHTREGIQTVEGCRVTHLQDDGEDVKNLLLAIYDPGFFEPPPKDVPVEIVLSVARLSHKYEIQHLRHRAILHIERNYPADMDTFLTRSRGALSGQSSWFYGLETMLDIIVTATAIKALWVLPAVYYNCTYRTPPHTFRASPSWKDPQKMLILRDILTGNISLEIMDMAYANFLGTPPCSGCLTRESCALHTLAMAHKLRKSLTPTKKPAGRKCHTLTVWWDRKWLTEQHCKKLCTPCASACISAYESARSDYWDGIPSAFNLPSWEELMLLKGTDQMS